MSNDERRSEQIKAHNKRLLEAVSQGYNCVPIPLTNYFYPPRPIIKKDENALQFIHKRPKLSLVE